MVSIPAVNRAEVATNNRHREQGREMTETSRNSITGLRTVGVPVTGQDRALTFYGVPALDLASARRQFSRLVRSLVESPGSPPRSGSGIDTAAQLHLVAGGQAIRSALPDEVAAGCSAPRRRAPSRLLRSVPAA